MQSRPITAYLPREDYPEVTNADLKDGGISARVCTPCMFSLYQNALQFSMGEYFKKIQLIFHDENIQWIYAAYGRAYWNAQAVKDGLKKIPDFKEDDFDRNLGIQKDYGAKGPFHSRISIQSVLGAIPVLINLYQEFNDCMNMISSFRNWFESEDMKLKKQIKNLSYLKDEEFNQWLYEVIIFQGETERCYFRTIYNNSNYQSEFKSFLKKNPQFVEGDEIDLMSELSGISHLDVQKSLAKLWEVFQQHGMDSKLYLDAREEFLSTHYHHGPASWNHKCF